MYKLLIAEDEDFIRETIVNCIDWQSIGFIVQEAEDGERALEVAAEFKPDALLTDIRMPIVDGLELSRRLKQMYPNLDIIILSGHDEFSYAQESITIGASEYLMKPIMPDEFRAAMARVYERLSKKRGNQLEIEKLRQQWQKSLPLLRERLLNKLIIGFVPTNELAALDLEIQGEGFWVLLFTAHSDDENSDLIGLALLNGVSEEVGDRGICFNDTKGRLVVVFCAKDKTEEDSDFIFELTNMLLKNNQYSLEFTITAAIGSYVDTLDELPFSYETVQNANENEIIYGKGRVYDYLDFGNKKVENYRFLSQISELVNCFRFKTRAEFTQALEQLTSNCENPDSMYMAFIDLLSRAHNVLVEADISLPSEAPRMYARVFSMDTAVFAQYLVKLKDLLDGKSQSRSAAIIEQVCTYIKENYDDCELSLQIVASIVFISPVYLSTLFKRELGQTFIDYVITTRMEQAKTLLKSGAGKNYEVALKVGYSDPQYFSNCFKKYTGMTPSEYRVKGV